MLSGSALNCEKRESNFGGKDIKKLREYSDYCPPPADVADLFRMSLGDEAFVRTAILFEDERNCKDLKSIVGATNDAGVHLGWLIQCMNYDYGTEVIALARHNNASTPIKKMAEMLESIGQANSYISFKSPDEDYLAAMLPRVLEIQVKRGQVTPVWSLAITQFMMQDPLAMGKLKEVLGRISLTNPESIKLTIELLGLELPGMEPLLKRMVLATAVSGPADDPSVSIRLNAIGSAATEKVFNSMTKEERNRRNVQKERLERYIVANSPKQAASLATVPVLSPSINLGANVGSASPPPPPPPPSKEIFKVPFPVSPKLPKTVATSDTAASGGGPLNLNSVTLKKTVIDPTKNIATKKQNDPLTSQLAAKMKEVKSLIQPSGSEKSDGEWSS